MSFPQVLTCSHYRDKGCSLPETASQTQRGTKSAQAPDPAELTLLPHFCFCLFLKRGKNDQSAHRLDISYIVFPTSKEGNSNSSPPERGVSPTCIYFQNRDYSQASHQGFFSPKRPATHYFQPGASEVTTNHCHP